MAANVDRLARMADRHAQQRESIILQLIKLLFGLWGDFGSSRDADARIALASKSATLVSSATSNSRRLTRSYLQSTLHELGVSSPRLPSLADSYPRSGVTPLDVYSRPAEQFVYALSQGTSVDESRRIAATRLTGLAEQDVKLAERDEASRVYRAVKEVIGYRRIIHPELSKSGTCGLCIVASQRFYHAGDLLPLHGPSCNCDTLPVVDGDDPGFRLNDDDLKRIYAAAGSNAAEDLQNTRISINEHGELGPVLVKQGDHFKTAKEAGRPEYVKPTPESLRKANRDARAQAQEQLDELDRRHTELAAADGGMTPNTDANSARTSAFIAAKNLREYIASLDRGFRSLDN